MYSGDGRPEANSNCRYVGTDNGGRGIVGGIGDGRAGSGPVMCGDGVRCFPSDSRLREARSCFPRDVQVCVSRSLVVGMVCRRELGVDTAREPCGRVRAGCLAAVAAETSMARSLLGRSLGTLSPVTLCSFGKRVADWSGCEGEIAACMPSDTARRPRSDSGGAAR